MFNGDESSYFYVSLALGSAAVLAIIGALGAWLKSRADRDRHDK